MDLIRASHLRCGDASRFATAIGAATIWLLFSVAAASFAEEPARKLISKDISFEKLKGQDFTGADFTGAKLDRADFTEANLSEAIGLGTANFGMGINAQRATFRRADLTGARMNGTYFEGADFRGANLRGAILQGRFHEAKFDDADVQDAVFLGTIGIESMLKDLQARGAIVDAAGFAAAVVAGRDFADCPLHGIELPETTLDDGKFRKADMHSAKLQQTSLQRAHLDGAILCYAQLQDANLTSADLAGTWFVGADMTGANLTKANCRDADFSGVCLRGVKFNGADLTNADFSNVDLTEADFEGAVLDGVKWEAAIIKDLRGMKPAEQAALQSRAARWKHDLSQAFNHVVRNYSTPCWFLSMLGGFAVLIIGWQRTKGHLSLKLLSALHLVATLPALAFAFLILSGTSPTAQFNGNFDGWSTWVRMWPMALGLSSLAVLAFLPTAIIAWISCFWRSSPGSIGYLTAVTILTGTALVSAVGTLLVLAPTA